MIWPIVFFSIVGIAGLVTIKKPGVDISELVEKGVKVYGRSQTPQGFASRVGSVLLPLIKNLLGFCRAIWPIDNS